MRVATRPVVATLTTLGPLGRIDLASSARHNRRMSEIVRIGAGKRWTDIVVYGGVARWVEVAENTADDVRGQIGQVLRQLDETAAGLGVDRRSLLEVVIYLADLRDAPTLDELWDAWVVPGQAPIRACVGAALSGNLRIEVIAQAAVAGG